MHRPFTLACLALGAGSALAAPFDVASTTVGNAYKIETTIEWTDTTSRTSWVVPKLGLTIPLSSAVEVEFSGTYRLVERNFVQEQGFGDVALKLKWAVLADDKEGWSPGFAIEPKVTFPTGDETRGLGTGDTILDLPVLLSKSFGAFELGVKLAYSANLGDGADATSWGVLGTVKVADGWLLGAELVGDAPATQLDVQRVRFNAGLKVKLNDKMTLDGLVSRTVRTPLSDESTSVKLVLEFKL